MKTIQWEDIPGMTKELVEQERIFNEQQREYEKTDCTGLVQHTEYQIHEWALMFPQMSDDEFDSLVEDIQVNGQNNPIIIYHGQIAEGRNRYLACKKLQIEPKVEEWTKTEDELLRYVFSQNFVRRNLDASQKAMIAVEFALTEETMAAKGRKGIKNPSVNFLTNNNYNQSKATQKAADRVGGTNRQYIADAKFIKNNASDLVDVIRDGKLIIPKAIKLVKKLPNLDDRKKALERVLKNEKIDVVIEEINFAKNPAQEIGTDDDQIVSSDFGILFAMKINEAALEDIKDILYQHGYSERPYKILVATDTKEVQAFIEPLINRLQVKAYEVEPQDVVNNII